MRLCYILNKCAVSCFEAAYASYFAVYFFLFTKSWCISVWSLRVFYVSVWVLSRVSGFLSQTKNMHERRVGSSKWTVGLFMCVSQCESVCLPVFVLFRVSSTQLGQAPANLCGVWEWEECERKGSWIKSFLSSPSVISKKVFIHVSHLKLLSSV